MGGRKSGLRTENRSFEKVDFWGPENPPNLPPIFEVFGGYAFWGGLGGCPRSTGRFPACTASREPQFSLRLEEACKARFPGFAG